LPPTRAQRERRRRRRGPYDRRDLIGHFVDRDKVTQRPCTHACCRGFRVHPSNFPVILPDRTLHRATDDELMQHFRRLSADDSDRARRGESQVLHEMERRDAASERRAESKRRAEQRRYNIAATRAATRQEREAEAHRITLAAEAATNGYLVNAKGRARGISDREILTGRESVFNRYASDEARDYFATHPRPTVSYFRGEDTRVVERATEPVRRRRGVMSRRAA